MNTKNTTENASATTAQPRPNYRIYDQTGSGVTEDIYAASLDDAIEQGREWIEAGDWGSDREGNTYRTIALECCVRELVYVPDMRSITALPGILDAAVMPDGSIRVECGPDTDLTLLPGAVIDGSTVDADGHYDAVISGVSMPTMIDDQATVDGDEYDCSGTHSDPLPDCPVTDTGEDVDSDGHCWVSTTEMGDQFGCRSHGGTRMSHYEVCRCCGQRKTTLTPGVQRNPNEAVETVTIEDNGIAEMQVLGPVRSRNYGHGLSYIGDKENRA